MQDVLVVGAGPVGLVLACELARRDVAVRVIDKLAGPTPESRAVAVHARSLELFARLGIVDAVIASGVKSTALEMHSGGETLARIAFDTVDSPFPFSVSTAQTETERILTARLAELGVTIDRGVELTGFEADGSGVRSTVRHADGSEETLESGWIAGCDGARSTVRHQAGLRLEGSFKGERFLLGDVEAEYELDRSAMHTFFSPDGGPMMAFPMRGQRMRLMAQVDAGGEAVEPTLELLQAITDERAPGIRIHSAHWLTFFDIHHAQVPRYRAGRAFVLGDAAHVHSPAGGQGMNTGMQDAFNLGWKLALAAGGRASETLLDSYHAERHPVAARVIKTSTAMTKLATLQSHLARTLRNHALHLATGLAPVQHVIATETEETAISYRKSPIVAGRHRRGGPHPGDRTRDGGAEHTILAITPATHPDAAAPSDPEQRYGFGDEGGLVVVRPDGYIGLLAAAGDEQAVTDYFARLGG